MSLGKKDIATNIHIKAQLSRDDSRKILDSFIDLIKNKAFLTPVKISNFGSFIYKSTPSRIGRNPKTKKEYLIPERNKLNFLVSNKVKKILN